MKELFSLKILPSSGYFVCKSATFWSTCLWSLRIYTYIYFFYLFLFYFFFFSPSALCKLWSWQYNSFQRNDRMFCNLLGKSTEMFKVNVLHLTHLDSQRARSSQFKYQRVFKYKYVVDCNCSWILTSLYTLIFCLCLELVMPYNSLKLFCILISSDSTLLHEKRLRNLNHIQSSLKTSPQNSSCFLTYTMV